MSKFTFLGYSPNALAMFIEILQANGINEDLDISIVQNIEYTNEIKFIPDGVKVAMMNYTDIEKGVSNNFVLGVNKPNSKLAVYQFFLKELDVKIEDYTLLIHNSSVISSSTKLLNGIIINPQVVLAPFSQLGNFVTINRSVSVGHHTHIDDFSTLHPGVNVAGHCKIGKGVTIGLGANIIDGIKIGDNAIVGAGSLVTKDVPSNAVVYGSPAKFIRTNSQIDS